MITNPFDFDGAKNLPEDLLLKWFIDDYNHARFLKSTRNVLLLGHRGCGKSMTLLYYSLAFELKKPTNDNAIQPLDYIGIYIPCSTPLSRRVDHDYFDNPRLSMAISEHYLVLSIGIAIATSIDNVREQFNAEDFESLSEDLSYIFNSELPQNSLIFRSIKQQLNNELAKMQEQFYSFSERSEFSSLRTFYTLISTFLAALKNTSLLRNSHFSLMMDDAQDLNRDQKLLLNSWLSFRDHSLFSFKVALATIADFDRRTANGGSIIEGHDYITINLEQPFQNENSQYGKLARNILERRLRNKDINCALESFFPEHPQFAKNINEIKSTLRTQYIQNNPNADTKQVSDYVYKQARAEYFRQRSRKANRPIYSGIETLIHLSSGVIRNLLLPCYWMYDTAVSEQSSSDISSISPKIQSDVIMKESEKLWTRVRDGLHNELEDCSKEQAEEIFNLVSGLADHFRDRLLNHPSEPRIVTFTVSERSDETDAKLLPILSLMRKAQILYRRSGTAKDEGRQEDYYTLNRMFWPARGLDPQGQHGRASIKSSVLISAMNTGKFSQNNSISSQGSLFNDQ